MQFNAVNIMCSCYAQLNLVIAPVLHITAPSASNSRSSKKIFNIHPLSITAYLIHGEDK